MTLRTRVLSVLFATVALLLTSCGQPTDVADVPEEGATPTLEIERDVATQPPEEPGDFQADVTVLNQVGDGDTVLVTNVSTEDPQRAFVVVYDDAHDAPGAPLGHAVVHEAEEGTLRVDLDEPLEDIGTRKLWAVVHVDAAPEGRFDRGNDPVMTADGDEDGDPVRTSFRYTVTSS